MKSLPLGLLASCALLACGAPPPSPPLDPLGPLAPASAVADAASREAGAGGDWALVATLASDALEGRAPGTEGSRKAREAIIAELTRCGVRPGGGASFERAIDPARGPGVNVFGLVLGREPERRVLVSAHYDHLGVVGGEVMNGADDNAAAVGSVVKMACAIAAGPQPRASLLVAFWDAEEPPSFLGPAMGSRAWVEDPHVPLASVEAAVVLDLVGGGLWPGSPVHVALGAESSPGLAAAIDQTPAPEGLVVAQAGLHLVEDLVATQAHQPWSDYDPFRRAEVPFVFLSNGQTEHYHTAHDDFATLDLAKLTRQTTWLTALASRLLNTAREAAPRWSPGERPEVDGQAARRLVEGALASKRFEGQRAVLERDLAKLADAPSTRALRVAVQRVQCLAARSYPPALCVRFE